MEIEDLHWEKLNPPASEDVIKNVEQQLNITFSSCVRNFLKLYHGGQVNQDYAYIIYYDDPVFEQPVPANLSAILSFDKTEYFSIVRIHQLQGFPQYIIPFARDSAGNYFCLDFGSKHILTEPSILFCALDLAIDNPFIHLAANFSKFLELIVVN